MLCRAGRLGFLFLNCCCLFWLVSFPDSFHHHAITSKSNKLTQSHFFTETTSVIIQHKKHIATHQVHILAIR